MQGRIRLPEIQAEFDRQLNEGRFQKVDHIRPNAPAARYTTPELIQTERDAIERVRAGHRQKSSLSRSLRRLEIEAASLNEDQRRLVIDALCFTRPDLRHPGWRGNGQDDRTARRLPKSRSRAGYQSLGLGPTSRAAKGLKEAGMQAETLQAFLTRGNQPTEDARPRLFFVDESSLASGRQMRDFLDRLQPQDRVLLIGDARQHQSVEAGRIFEELQRAGMNTATLSKIVRQKDEGLRTAVEAMASGQIEKGVELLARQNRIQTIEHRGDRFKAIAKAFAESPEGTLVVSPDNNSRRELNAAIRSELRESGQLGGDVYKLPVLINRQEITGEDRKLAASYRVGDSVRYTRGSDALGLEAKSYATVIQVDAEQNRITVQKADGGR